MSKGNAVRLILLSIFMFYYIKLGCNMESIFYIIFFAFITLAIGGLAAFLEDSNPWISNTLMFITIMLIGAGFLIVFPMSLVAACVA